MSVYKYKIADNKPFLIQYKNPQCLFLIYWFSTKKSSDTSGVYIKNNKLT